MFGISRGKICFLLFLVLCAFFAWNVAKDLGLGWKEPTGKISSSPDVTVQDLRFSREISGDKWNLAAERVMKLEGKYSLRDVQVSMDVSNGNRWIADSPEGSYYPDEDIIFLKMPSGVLSEDMDLVHWSAPKAKIALQSKTVDFAEGIKLKRDGMRLSGRSGNASFGGLFTVSGGSEVFWEEE